MSVTEELFLWFVLYINIWVTISNFVGKHTGDKGAYMLNGVCSFLMDIFTEISGIFW